jgi:hypothetical protein
MNRHVEAVHERNKIMGTPILKLAMVNNSSKKFEKFVGKNSSENNHRKKFTGKNSSEKIRKKVRKKK